MTAALCLLRCSAPLDPLSAFALGEAAGGRDHIPVDRAALHQQAGQSGFACQFQALRRNVPWRAVLMDDTGLRPRPRPTALGTRTAIVAGPNGNVNASGTQRRQAQRIWWQRP